MLTWNPSGAEGKGGLKGHQHIPLGGDSQMVLRTVSPVSKSSSAHKVMGSPLPLED